MTSPQGFLGFWETTGSAKTFTHPLDPALLDAYVPRGARVLDYGCGYGRLTAELAGLGLRRGPRGGCLGGADRAGAAGASGAGADAVRAGFPLPFEDGAFDAALLFAVLTCVPGDADQTAIVGELGRLVRPGGVLYLSDVPLQNDALNRERYARFAERYGTYGVFETPDGGVFRHHPPERLRGLLREAGFAVVEGTGGRGGHAGRADRGAPSAHRPAGSRRRPQAPPGPASG